MHHAINLDGRIVKVYLVQQQTFLHSVIRIAAYDLTFQLKQNDGNCLFRRLIRVCFVIHLFGKQNQWTQTDSVALFQHRDIVVGKTVAYYCGNTCLTAAGCTHPQNVVVAPLDVQ